MVFGINRRSTILATSKSSNSTSSTITSTTSEDKKSKRGEGDSWRLVNDISKSSGLVDDISKASGYYVQYVADAANNVLSEIVSAGKDGEGGGSKFQSTSSRAVKYSPSEFRALVMKKLSFSSGSVLPKDYVCYSKLGIYNSSIEVKRNAPSQLYLERSQILVQIEVSTYIVYFSKMKKGIFIIQKMKKSSSLPSLRIDRLALLPLWIQNCIQQVCLRVILGLLTAPRSFLGMLSSVAFRPKVAMWPLLKLRIE